MVRHSESAGHPSLLRGGVLTPDGLSSGFDSQERPVLRIGANSWSMALRRALSFLLLVQTTVCLGSRKLRMVPPACTVAGGTGNIS